MSSWAEQYEARKAARLLEEKSKLNENLGFGFSGSLAENGEQVDSLVVAASNNDKEAEEHSVEIDTGAKSNTGQMVQEAFVFDVGNGKKETSEDVIRMKESPANCSKPKASTSSDPWYSTYEAKKAAALENLKSGNLQSVAGTSGFVGKIEGVEQLSKQNEVTRLMNRLKQDEPKAGCIHVTSVNTSSDSRSDAEDTDKTVTKVKTVLTVTNVDTATVLTQSSPAITTSVTSSSSSVYSSKPPPPPRQLVQQAIPGTWAEEPSSPPSNRPSRPSVPTPSKYGTLYGGAPSPGPCPSRSFQPPGFVPPTPPGSRARKPARPNSQVEGEKDKKDSFQSLVRTVKADSKLSTSSWQEEYLARKKARLEDSL